MNNKRKIRIIMISLSSKLGGGTKHMFDLGENLRNDFEIFYALPNSDNFSQYLNSNNHIYLSEREITFQDICKLSNFIKSKYIDLIHAHGKGAGLISRIVNIFLKRKLIYTFHGIHYELNSNFIKKIYILYENLMGKIDSCKILVSKSELVYAKSLSINLEKNSIVINNGVTNKSIRHLPETIQNDFEKINPKFNVITVCRLVRQKNVIEILRIAKLLPELNFIILGKGELWKELNDFIFKEKIYNVFFRGAIQDVYKYLYKADVYLSTSLYEGLPISILEAMSIGLPVIASNVIGNSDTIINGESGYLYNLNSGQFKSIQDFFETMPRLKHDIEVDNPVTKTKSTVTLEGVQSFF